MSHAASFLSGLPPAQSTLGVAIQNFGICGPGLPAHATATRSRDTEEQQPPSAIRNVNARPHLAVPLREAIFRRTSLQGGCRGGVLRLRCGADLSAPSPARGADYKSAPHR